MTPGLPWPWRACRGGVVRCATGEVVTRCEDRRAATAGVTAVELADRINATHPGGIVARASDAGRITLTAC